MLDKELLDICKELHKIYLEREKILEGEVDFIIKNKITDINYIEHILDFALDTETCKGEELFFKLNDYYKGVNLEFARGYEDIYKEYHDFPKVLEKK